MEEVSAREILVKLINFSSYDRPLNSNYFIEQFGSRGLTKRELRLLINEIIDNEDNYMVCSNDKGYYIAKTEEEAEHGINWISKMEEKLGERRSKMEKLFNKLFVNGRENKEPELFT